MYKIHIQLPYYCTSAVGLKTIFAILWTGRLVRHTVYVILKNATLSNHFSALYDIESTCLSSLRGRGCG